MNTVNILTSLELVCLLLCSVVSNKTTGVKKRFIDGEKNYFFYFAYGTNMLEKRLQLDIPRAIFFSPALLKSHRLDFTLEVSWWNGAVATICKDPGESVWGVLWIIKWADKEKLDIAEGVRLGWFHSETVRVQSIEGDETPAIAYVQNHNPKKLSPWEVPPPERQPSATYLRVLILGAVQGGLPAEYIRFLYSIRHNGKQASQEIIDKLGSPFSKLKKKIDVKVFI